MDGVEALPGTVGDASDGQRSRWTHLARGQIRAVGYLAGNMFLGALGLLVLVVAGLVGILSLVGIGLLLGGAVSFVVRRWCDHARARTGRFRGRAVGSPYLQPASMRPSAVRDHLVGGILFRDLGALLLRSVVGVPLGLVAILLPLVSLNSALIPLYWRALPEDETAGALFAVTSWWGAAMSSLVGLVGLALWLAAPLVARADSRLAARLLAPTQEQDLRRRVALERNRRRSAVSAHAAELQRIERDLHDAAQNRLVAVSMLVGMAQRQLSRGSGDPAPSLEKAQAAATGALAEVRRIIQGIHPPVLTAEGLLPALGLLADRAQIPTRLHVEQPEASPAAIDAALYYSIAEALTNVAKHSGATECDVYLAWPRIEDDCWVTAEVVDNGRGGAHASPGGGLEGIERRVQALGGWLQVASPAGGPTSLRMGLPCGW